MIGEVIKRVIKRGSYILVFKFMISKILKFMIKIIRVVFKLGCFKIKVVGK